MLGQLGAETARQFPELAHWHVPVLLGIVLGTGPLSVGMALTWRLLALIDRGEASRRRRSGCCARCDG